MSLVLYANLYVTVALELVQREPRVIHELKMSLCRKQIQLTGDTLVYNTLTRKKLDEHVLPEMMPAEKCSKLTWNR